jgi:Immunity protein Imm5
MRSDEDIVAGRDEPWRIGEMRTYVPVRLVAGDGEFVTEAGYHSAPSLWDAMMLADGPIACAVEVSDPISTGGDREQGYFQISSSRKLLAAIDLSSELRLFACACAERVLSIFETAYPRDARPRQAISIALDYARQRATAEDLKAALVLARDAADKASGLARIAAMSAFGTTILEAQDAALTAMRGARRAVDGKSTTGTERTWHREYIDRNFAHLFNK